MEETKVQVIDNALSEEDFNAIFNTITDSGYSGWRMSNAIGPELNLDGKETQFQFVKSLYCDIALMASPELEELKPLFDLLGAYKLLRVKANVQGMGKEIEETGYHIDINGLGYPNIKIALLYLNTNNGCTKTKGGQVVESVRNRVAILDNTTYHTSTNATDAQYRIVLNVVYMEKSMYQEPEYIDA